MSSPAAPTTDTTASAVAVPPNSSTDTRRRSRNLTPRPARPARRRTPSTPSTTRSARSTIAGGPSSERTPTAPRRRGALLDERVERVEGVEVGDVVAAEQRARAPAQLDQSRTARPLSNSTGGRSSSTLRPQCVARPAPRPRRRSPRRAAVGGLLVGRPAPVQRGDRPLVLDAHAQPAQVGRSRSATNAFTRPSQLLNASFVRGWPRRARAARRRATRRRRCRRRRPAGAPRPPSGRRCSRRSRSGARAGPAAGGLLAHLGVLGARHDRREHAVDVAEDRGTRRVRGQAGERLRERR